MDEEEKILLLKKIQEELENAKLQFEMLEFHIERLKDFLES